MRAGQYAGASTDAAADARAGDDSENDVAPGRSAIGRFRERETVGIVGDADISSERCGKVFVQGMADQPRRVRVLHEAGDGRDRSGNRDANTSAFVQFALNA